MPPRSGRCRSRAAIAERLSEPAVANHVGKEIDASPVPATRGARAQRVGATSRRRLALLIVVAVVCGAVAWLLAPARSTTEDRAPLAERARTSEIELSYPRGYRQVAVPSAFGLREPVAVAAPGSAGMLVAAGTVDAAGRLLQPALLEQLGAAPVATTVKLGELEAKRYVGGGRRAYAVATSAGVATVICDRAAAKLPAADCERIAASLALRRSTAYPAGPSASTPRSTACCARWNATVHAAFAR